MVRIWFVYVYDTLMDGDELIGELDERKRVVGIAQAAAFLGVSKLTLKRWVGKGVIRARRKGHVLKFRSGDLYDLWETWPKALTMTKRREARDD